MKTVFFEATWNFETDIADVTFRQRDETYLNKMSAEIRWKGLLFDLD